MPGQPHPTPWLQGMWAQGGKWVRAGLEFNPIGPKTSLPAPEAAGPQRSLLPPPKGLPFLLLRKEDLAPWCLGKRNWKPPSGQRRDNPLTPGLRFCTKHFYTRPRDDWQTPGALTSHIVQATSPAPSSREWARSGLHQGRGRAHGRTAWRRRLFCLVRLQLGKHRNPSLRGICQQCGALFSVYNLRPKPVVSSSLSVPLFPFPEEEMKEWGGITPGRGHQVSRGPCFGL